MKKLCILFGGRSPEHDVSCLSAASVIGAVNRSHYEIVTIGITREGKWLLYDGSADKITDGSWQEYAEQCLERDPEHYAFTVLGSGGRSLRDLVDFVLPVVHGPYCEDGRLQGLLEMADIPYGGCGVTASAASMDKIIAKQIFEQAGIPVVPYQTVFGEETQAENTLQAAAQRIEEALGLPVYIKPANMGSSVGISRAVNREEILSGLRLAAEYDRRILVEKAVDCREIETAVLGNYDVKVSIPGEIVATEDFYDYEAKYVDDGKPKMKIPAELDEATRSQLQTYAAAAYRSIDGAGFSRCDFFLEKETGRIYLNEINTIPGFTSFSMFPLLWEATGSPYSETIERIIELGYERYQAASHRETALL